jgi:hypothetical protein
MSHERHMSHGLLHYLVIDLNGIHHSQQWAGLVQSFPGVSELRL